MGKIYTFTFLISLAISFFITPAVKKIALRYKVLDYPSTRKIHQNPIPRWGGAGLYLSFVASVILALIIFSRFRSLLKFASSGISLSSEFSGILVGATIIMVLGLFDDKMNLPPITKLLGQIIAVLVVINYGVKIGGINLPLFKFIHLKSLLLSQIITIFWFLIFINGVNFADGLDGLATGIVTISSFTFLAVAILQTNTSQILVSKNLKLVAIFSSALAGSCLGFLRYNFFPAKIFMGDTGSMFLGFMLATITVIGTLKTTAVMALFIPVLAVGLPLVDIIITVWRRWHKKVPIFNSDREHLHHQLLDRGWTQREVVLLSYVLSGILGILAILSCLVAGRPA